VFRESESEIEMTDRELKRSIEKELAVVIASKFGDNHCCYCPVYVTGDCCLVIAESLDVVTVIVDTMLKLCWSIKCSFANGIIFKRAGVGHVA
jgi:cadmium resistance protein CadD (predicted permease)